MLCDRLQRGPASLARFFRFHAYSFLPFVIALKVSYVLLSCKPYMFGYYVCILTH